MAKKQQDSIIVLYHRCWEVRDPARALVCLEGYKRGTVQVLRRTARDTGWRWRAAHLIASGLPFRQMMSGANRAL